jgi:hypothetical protein
MLLKAVGQPLGTAKRVEESRWEIAQRLLNSLWAILIGYRKVIGKCPKFAPSANRREGRIARGY